MESSNASGPFPSMSSTTETSNTAMTATDKGDTHVSPSDSSKHPARSGITEGTAVSDTECNSGEELKGIITGVLRKRRGAQSDANGNSKPTL